MKTKSKVSNINHLSVEEFNKLYPIGTKVKYYPVYSFPEFEITETDSKAYEMCGMKMVSLTRGHGGYCFDNIFVSKCLIF